MTNNLHHKLLKTRSAFAEVSVAAILVWVGDLLCVVGDIGWLIGDMRIQLHPHHYIVGIVLLIAFSLIAVSGIWLYRGLSRYVEKHERCVAKKHKSKRMKMCVCARNNYDKENNMVIKGIIDKHFPKGSFHDKRWEIGHPSSDAFREEYKLKPGYLDPNRDFNKPDPEGQEVDKGNRAWYARVIEARTIGEMR